MNCETVREQLPLLLYDEAPPDERAALERHLAECPSCRQEMETARRIHALVDQAAASPPDVLLHQCRRELRSRVAELPAARSGWRRWLAAWNATLRAPFSWPLPAWAGPLGAVALLAIGFFGARLVPDSSWFSAARSAGGEVVARRVRQVLPREDGRVGLVVEETRQRQIEGRLADSGVRELLLAAAVDPQDPGLRVESVELLGGYGTRDVRDALLAVLSNDSNPGVRLKALEGLQAFAGEAEVRQALLNTVLKDDNSGVRAQVIDVLTRNRRVDMVGALQDLMLVEDNDYIRERTQTLLRMMNASVETF